MKASRAGRVGLVFSNLFGSQPSDALKTIGFTASMQFFKPGELAGVRGDNNLAASFMRDIVLLAKPVHRVSAFDAISCFQGAWFVVKAGVNHAAVVPGLMCSKPVFSLEEDHSQSRSSSQQRIRRSEPNNAATDNRNVVHNTTHNGSLILQEPARNLSGFLYVLLP
jgi:hypothetical protein